MKGRSARNAIVENCAAQIKTTGGLIDNGAMSVEGIYAQMTYGDVKVKGGNIFVLGSTGKGIGGLCVKW